MPIFTFAQKISRAMFILRGWKSAHTFSCPRSAEDAFTGPIIDIIFQLINEFIGSPQFVVRSDSSAACNFPLFFVSKSSRPEPVLFYEGSDAVLGLIASEAKGLSASMFMTYAQAVQVASDLAVHLFRSKEIVVYENVVIPFISTSWDDVQFGAVYLIEDNFPCPILLSRRLSLNCFADLREICSWTVALSQHCKRVVSQFCVTDLTVRSGFSFPICDAVEISVDDIKVSDISGKRKRAPESMGPPRKVAKSTLVSLASSYIFKSVSLITKEPALFRSVLSSLLSRFHDLYHSNDSLLLESIVFPEGVVGFPDEN